LTTDSHSYVSVYDPSPTEWRLRRWFQTSWTLWVDRCHSCCRPCSWTTIPLTSWHPASVQAISSKFPGHSIWPNQGRISFPNGRIGFVREVMNRQISSLLSFQFHSAILGERPFGTMVETWDGIYLLGKQHHRYPLNWWTISHSTYLPNWIEFIEIQWIIFHSTWLHPFAWVSEDGRLYANVSPVSVTASFCKGRVGRCGAQFGSTNRKCFVKQWNRETTAIGCCKRCMDELWIFLDRINMDKPRMGYHITRLDFHSMGLAAITAPWWKPSRPQMEKRPTLSFINEEPGLAAAMSRVKLMARWLWSLW
jgi:hypothetical protein